MKLPGISYDIRANLGREDVSMPVAIEQQRQRAIGAATQAALDYRDMRDRSQINKADVEMTIFESELRKKYEGSLYGRSDQLPDYLDIERVDSEGNPTEIPMSDVWPEIYRTEMTQKAESLASGMQKRKTADEWSANARIQIESRFQGHQASAQKQIKLEAAQSDSLSAEMLAENNMYSQAEALVRQSIALTEPEKREKISLIQKQRDEFFESQVEQRFITLNDEIAVAAREGEAVDSMKETLIEEVDGLYRNGVISSAKKAEMTKQVRITAYTESEIGNIRRLISDGESEKAYEQIEALMLSEPKAGMLTSEWDDFTDTLRAEANSALQVKQRQEVEGDSSVDRQQKKRSQSLYNGLLDGTVTKSDILKASINGEINQSQADKLVSVYERRGSGIDNPIVINSIRQMIVEGGDPEAIKNAILSQTGNELTTATATQLSLELAESTVKGGILQSEEYKSARRFLQDATETTGPLGNIDPNKSKAWSALEREMRSRVIAGENPYRVADSLVVKKDYHEARSKIKFGINPDGTVSAASVVNELNRLYSNGEISKELYNQQYDAAKRLARVEAALSAIEEGAKNAQ